MAAEENVEIVREIFRAIEDRDWARLVARTDRAHQFHEPLALPSAVRWDIAPPAGRRSVVGRNLASAAAQQGRANAWTRASWRPATTRSSCFGISGASRWPASDVTRPSSRLPATRRQTRACADVLLR